jgi:hypothetical protein
MRDYRWCAWSEPKRSGAPTLAVVGDSTANALDYATQDFVDNRGWGYIAAGQNGCSLLPLPFPGQVDDRPSLVKAEQCVEAVTRVLEDVRTEVHPDVWLVADRWMTFPMQGLGDRALQPGTAERDDLVRAALRDRLRELTSDGAKVVWLITPPPGPPAECALQESRACESRAFSTDDPVTKLTRDLVQDAVSEFDGKAVSVEIDDLVCPDDGRCPAAIAGILVRYDGIHFTARFGRQLVPEVFQRARRLGIRP